MVGSRGGQEVRIPPRKSQKYRFFSNTGPDSLKIVKLLSQLSILAIIGTLAKRHLNGGSLAG